MKVHKILILVGHGPDKITLFTDLPDAIVTCPDDRGMGFTGNAPAKSGKAYVAEHFPGVPVEIVTMPEHKYNFGGGGSSN